MGKIQNFFCFCFARKGVVVVVVVVVVWGGIILSILSFVLSLKSEFKPSEDRLKSHNDSLRYITLNSVLIFFAFFKIFL